MDIPDNPLQEELLEMMSDVWSTKQVDRNRLCSFLRYLFEKSDRFRPIGLKKEFVERGVSIAYFSSLKIFQGTPIVQVENASDDEISFTHNLMELQNWRDRIFFNSKPFEIQDFGELVDSFYK